MKKYYVPDLKTRIVLLYLGGKTVSELATPKSKKGVAAQHFYKTKKLSTEHKWFIIESLFSLKIPGN